MEMTYREPQTPLFHPPYVNLVHAKDPWKRGESQHNTHCDVTVGIANVYAPNTCIPAHVLGQLDLHSQITDAGLPDIAINTNKNV